MKRVFFVFSAVVSLILAISFNSCQQACVNNILLQTTKMDIKVNNDNLGIPFSEPQNSGDTIRNSFKQFYSYSEFRQFGHRFTPAAPSLFTSAYAADDCPDQEEYISRMDPSKTKLSLDIAYDASSFGLGMLPADTNLLDIVALRDPYLLDILENDFLNAGAPTPVTILRDFFEPINTEWVTFQFYFEEMDGTVFLDSVKAYIDLVF